MNVSMHRRSFLKSALAWGAFGSGFAAMLGRQALAQAALDGRKLIFVFQRGGNDGINTVIPRGDSQYSAANRPTLFIPEGTAVDTGNGFAQLHPALQPMMEIYNHTALNGIDGPGNLAVIHRVGYDDQSRSHFDSQDYWEKGVPREPSVRDGIFYRQLAATSDLSDPALSFSAASLSSSALTALNGATPFPNFTSASTFNFLGSTALRQKFRGASPSAPDAGDGSGMLGLYGDAPFGPASIQGTVHATGRALGGTLESLSAASGAYTPENGAVYPNGSFGSRLQEAAMLFKRTSVRILGVNIGGWDNHTGQGTTAGPQASRLDEVAQGFQALYRDLQSQWQDVLIVTMTEFGRTTIENGSAGTDHAEASCMFLAGGGVKGGIYNCDSATSGDSGAMFEVRGRYLSHRTDFRSVFAEIFAGHFGDDAAQLDSVIPGYSALASSGDPAFAPLGIMQA